MSIPMLQPAFATFPRRLSFADAGEAFTRIAGPTVAVLHTLEAADAIAGEWRALEAATPDATGFQSFDWCRAWMRANAADAGSWRILTVREGGRLVALWPLQRRRLLGARMLGWLGEPWTQYGDVLVAAGPQRIAYLAAGWREITAWSDVDVVKLGRVRADAALMALPGFQGTTATHRETAPFVDMRHARPRISDKNLRARRRKLEAFGPVAFDIVSDDTERRGCIAQALARKRVWLRSRGLASSGLWHAAIEDALDAMAESDALSIGRLTVGGETAALELGLRTPAGFRSLLACHEPRFATGSPGHLLIAQMIDWCHEEGIGAYDLMVPADAYKRRWATDEIAVVDHVVALRTRGRLAAAWFHARPRVKAAYADMPDWLRARLNVWTPSARR